MMQLNSRLITAIFAAVFLCSSFSVLSSDRKVIPINEIVPDTMPGSMELDVVPTPKKADLSDNVIKLGKTLLVAPDYAKMRAGRIHLLNTLGHWHNINRTEEKIDIADYESIVILGKGGIEKAAASGLKINTEILKNLPQQGYVCSVKFNKVTAKTIVILAGNNLQSDFWAIQTFRQLAFVTGKDSFVRLGTIRDWPTFEWRGNKRTQRFEGIYKANFYNASALYTAGQYDYYIDGVMREIHPIKLGRLKKPLSVEKTLADIRKAVKGFKGFRTNVVAFCILFDDVEDESVEEKDKEKYGGYYGAIQYIVKETDKILRKESPETKLFFMPQFYFSNNRDFEHGGSEMRKYGGLPAGTGIYTNGPEVNSTIIPVDSIKNFKTNLGADKDAKGLLYCPIYDVDGYEYAQPARSADLSKEVWGLIPESGSWLNKITYYAWAWNAENFDAERAEMLACREIMGIEKWQLLYDYTSSLKKMLLHKREITDREILLKEADEILKQLPGKLEKIVLLNKYNLNSRFNEHEDSQVQINSRMFGAFAVDEIVFLERAASLEEINSFRHYTVKDLIEKQLIKKEDIGYAYDFEARNNYTIPALCDGIPARIIGDVKQVAGAHNSAALSLDGEPGNYIEIPFVEAMNNPDFTLSMWLKSSDTSSYNSFLKRINPVDAKKSLRLMSAPNDGKHTNSTYGYLNFCGKKLGRERITDNKWHNVVIRSEKDAVTVFIDGISKFNGKLDLFALNNTQPVTVGLIRKSKNFTYLKKSVLIDWDHYLDISRSILKYYQKVLTEKSKNILKHASAMQVTETINVDGKLQEESWQKAPEQKGFDMGRRSRSTVFKVLYDKENLYFGLKGQFIDRRGKLYPDHIRILIDPDHSHMKAYDFVISPGEISDSGEYNLEEGRLNSKSSVSFYSQIKTDKKQGKNPPLSWKYSYSVDKNIWSLEVAINRKNTDMELSSGKVMGIRLFSQNVVWSRWLSWRGKIDPEQFGHLHLGDK
ncbi:MAG: LamG-like jellyroll fold domain-containing protein [Planctomycetota bacterium]|jgi:hypothetical protein